MVLDLFPYSVVRVMNLSEEKLCRILKQDLLLLCVGVLLFASGLFLGLGEVTFVLVFVGLGVMGAAAFDTLRVVIWKSL